MTRNEVLLRRGALALSALATVGVAVELAVERHWRDGIQLLPWYALAALAVAITLAALARDPGWIVASRWLAAGVMIVSAFGILRHIAVNLDSGALDGLYGPSWASLSWPRQLWLAVSKTVGPTPPFAPGVLAQAALLVLLSAWRQSGHRRRSEKAQGMDNNAFGKQGEELGAKPAAVDRAGRLRPDDRP